VLFNSHLFLFAFLPLVLAVFFGLSRFRLTRAATASLVAASLIFYGYWNPLSLPLLLGSIGFNFWLGKRIYESRTDGAARRLMWMGVGLNLAGLAYFKYTGFLVGSLNSVLQTGWPTPEILLPLGISFFTFTQIAFLVDAYRGEIKHHNLTTYALFVTFFPHLIAGPILHHKSILPQFHRLRNHVFSHANMAAGLMFLGIGLFKKVAIADNLAPWVGPVFSNAGSVSFIEAWVGALAYTCQLYFDFSGYSDMAVGLGLMLNIRLPFNFNSPYKATSIVDFWRRWHMTLSGFLRDYLYIPLGGNRHGEARRMINLTTTMLLGGLWHGAGWTFVVWGALHGTYLVINHQWRRLGRVLPRPIAWPLTFLAVVVAWVFFRAASVHDAGLLLQAMAGLRGISLSDRWAPTLQALSLPGVSFVPMTHLPMPKETIIGLVAAIVATAVLPNSQELVAKLKPTRVLAIGFGLATLYAISNMNKVSEFLYFQF
jgi:alginate O-acetyltransferase complex protein AlgI